MLTELFGEDRTEELVKCMVPNEVAFASWQVGLAALDPYYGTYWLKMSTSALNFEKYDLLECTD